MKKIPTMFVRSETNRAKVTAEVNPECQWVFDGEGVATRKFDGTACAVIGGLLYARYDLKADKKTGKRKPAPEGAIPCQPETDEGSGHWPHWVLVTDQPEYKYHREAWANCGSALPDGTYELCGPNVQGNPEKCERHVLIRHGVTEVRFRLRRDYEGLREFLRDKDWEGIVWHHPDGRMAKIKKRDFDYS